MKIITPKFLKYFISNGRVSNKVLRKGKSELFNKKFLFIHKGEHLSDNFPIIVLFKFIKVNIKVLGGERGPKNEVLKIGRLERLKVRLYV